MESNRFLWNCPLYCSCPISRIDVEMTTTPVRKTEQHRRRRTVCAMTGRTLMKMRVPGLSGPLGRITVNLLPMFMEVLQSSACAFLGCELHVNGGVEFRLFQRTPDSLRSHHRTQELFIGLRDQQPHVIFSMLPSTRPLLVRRSWQMFPFC